MTDTAPIRWGILATGGIARSFTEDLQLLTDARVGAVGSRTVEAARSFADRYGIPRAYGSWAELAADPELDVIYVATPHSAHYEAASLCLAAGKAVLCEKPLTLDLPSTRRLIELARDRGVFLMEAMWMLTNPAILRIAELVAEGAIGDITYIHADFGVPGPFPPEHRMRALDLGGGALLDLGVYPLTFAYRFLGVPDRVIAWASLNPEGSDANTAILTGYRSGAAATLQCGMVGESPMTATIVGTRGRIEVPRLFFRPDRFTLCRDGKEETVEVPFRGNGMSHEAEEAMRCLRDGLTESPLVPHRSTMDVMATMDDVRAQIGVAYPG